MGYIYLYYGTGGGKTANALGLALRTVGHRRKAVIIQFLKWRKDTGEYLIEDRLKPFYEIYQFGREAWLGMEESDKVYANEKFRIEGLKLADRKLAKKALDFALEILEQRPHLLVLDEIALVVHWGLLPVKEVLDFLDKIPTETTTVLTGRLAPKELIERADFVNVVTEIKMPARFEIVEGIQY
jgi:cob(I)alamin adenosyltransferase